MRCAMSACGVLLVLGCGLLAQQLSSRLTNQDVIEMASLGLSDGVIIDKIHASDVTVFDTSVPALKTLKAAKVSDAVIQAMINPRPVAAGVGNVGSQPSGTASSGLPDEAGVYVVIKGRLTEIEPEIVGWQTGGVLKRDVTLGIDKGHINGKIMGPRSPVRVSGPVEFVIKTLEGTSATEYQLLKLYEKGNRREFRALTGGVLHASKGDERNVLPFQPEKVANRIWKVRLDLRTGEYGFLPPGVSSASIASSGKMYTFEVLEGTGAKQSLSQDQEVRDSSGAEIPTDQVFSNASIGASSNQDPKLRRDGVTITAVVQGGPADRAGIKAGDAILAINDHYLFTVEELDSEVDRHKPGSTIAVRYRRHSTIYDVNLVVGTGK